MQTDPLHHDLHIPRTHSFDNLHTHISEPLPKSKAQRSYSAADLSPCHICHQRPRYASELDSYAACQACGERTCYICIRRCEGSSLHPMSHQPEIANIPTTEDVRMGYELQVLLDGQQQEDECHARGGKEQDLGEGEHRDLICSRCCVEQGAEGEVRCLGCLRSEEGG
jgi:hypothetical protein